MAETTKTYTEREVIERERAAYVNGMVRGSAREFQELSLIDAAARKAYPLPKVGRPRVVVDPHASAAMWRMQKRLGMKPRIEVRWTGEDWKFYPRDVESMFPTPERVALWADLLANPFELVEDDGSAAASPEGR